MGIEPYLQLAEKSGVKITHIIDTHIHADHLSGSRKLAEATGAPIYLPESAAAS
ncbi:MAG: MBL fold metallo-hydrolase, partial [Nitrospinae bacterium]|nr:MBL fold metallo-hydrolase [Nitrospinota bacterium]